MQTHRTYIIAEAGVNHNGSLDLAKNLIEVAAEAGADAVKFQTFKADKLVTRNAPKAEYQIKATDADETQYEMIHKLELDEHAHKTLIEHCDACGIEFLSTPFDLESVELLAVRLNISRIKISSGDITNGPLLLNIAQTGKSVILSTGMSTLGEIEDALGVLAFGFLKAREASIAAFRAAYSSSEGQAALQEKVTLLHCTTEYPAPFEDVNLKVLDTLRAVFGLSVGYSDHTEGVDIPVAAVARGAVVIEKHFTMDRSLPGPDQKASLEPPELKQMVTSIRNIEKSLGSSIKHPAPSELKNVEIARKSLVAACMIKAGELLSTENVAIKRPSTGISPLLYWKVLGRKAVRDFHQDEVIEL